MRTKIEPVRKGSKNVRIKRGNDHAGERPIRGVQPSGDIDLPEIGLQPANKRADEHTLLITRKQKLMPEIVPANNVIPDEIRA